MALGWHALRFVEDARKTRQDCLVCGRPMWLPKSKLHWHLRCGAACQAISRAEEKEKRRRQCDTCGKVFYPRLTQLRAGGGRYCSQPCNTASHEVLGSPANVAYAQQRARDLRAAGILVVPRGPDNAQWRGGSAASKRRRQESGKAAETLRRYRAANPHKVREFAQRCGDRKVGRLPRGTIPRIGEAQRWRCAICATSIKRGYHMDHISPLARGGEHVGRNIQLLCKTCNVRKNAKDPIDYMRSLGRLL